MLKQQTASALLLRSRAYFVVGAPNPSPSRLSFDDSSFKSPFRRQTRLKTTMATGSESQAAAAEQPGAAEQSRQGRFPGGPLFPMGYKDAAYQWVGFAPG